MYPKITYCLLTLNRLDELQRAMGRVSKYVHRTIIIDGYSTDGTKEWLDSFMTQTLYHPEYKQIEQHLFQYGNHNPDKRNPYLEMAGPEGWILVTDTDEWLEEETVRNLYPLIEKAEAEGYNGIRFMPHDKWTMEDGTVISKRHTDYWTPMLFKAWPDQHYQGHTHVRLVRPGLQENWMNTNYYYEHVKDERRLWRNSTQNYWTTVGLAQNQTSDSTWLEFHEMMKSCGIRDWHEFDKIMTAGCVQNEITQWFIKHKNADNPEERSWFVWYYIFLHPDQNYDQMGNRDFPWDYVEQSRIKRQGML